MGGNENIIYVSAGNELADNSRKPLESYNYNKEEIDQVTCNSKSSFLAAADDGGGIKIIDIRQKRISKTLRSGHTSICSSVQFIPWRPWEVITGGLDSKLITWDLSKGPPLKIVDFGLPDMRSGSNAGQCLNPAFVHSIKVPEVDMLDKLGKICVVARGDGVIDVIDMESELTTMKPKCYMKSRKGTQSVYKGSDGGDPRENGTKWLHLDYSLGGHTAAVSCVAFSLFGERGRFLVSGGNDKLIEVWVCSKCLDSWQIGDNNELLHLNINLSKKVNWLCTTPSESDNIVICDNQSSEGLQLGIDITIDQDRLCSTGTNLD
ncbi:Transducin/WD40 repeat-like superfamily protein isoform 3 [Hibiscus syriacus]|uniref:Transducin/WD40 repeat-like superfamily protein isoform 3 n=1 Tax=Hibiscus syriacus TaxID=106335 RepID=A0A6A2XEW1_HIBSY|nr:Transducin/WD40 repeat-like superfamily protein isoform 3 [Hibiscus syriacus]